MELITLGLVAVIAVGQFLYTRRAIAQLRTEVVRNHGNIAAHESHGHVQCSSCKNVVARYFKRGDSHVCVNCQQEYGL